MATAKVSNPRKTFLFSITFAKHPINSYLAQKVTLPDYEVEGNAGSFFMNPIVSKEKFEELIAKYPNMPYYPITTLASSLGRAGEGAVKLPAGWLIDQCGWKGKTLGRAGVHDKQALVLVNKGGATGEEVVALCRQVQKDVLERFGVEIHPEVNIV